MLMCKLTSGHFDYFGSVGTNKIINKLIFVIIFFNLFENGLTIGVNEGWVYHIYFY